MQLEGSHIVRKLLKAKRERSKNTNIAPKSGRLRAGQQSPMREPAQSWG